MKKSFRFHGLLASLPLLLGALALGGCGGGKVTTVALSSVSFDKAGGYVLVPREARSTKERTLGADAYFCQNGSCQTIPVENLVDKEDPKKKKKRKGKGSFPLTPRYIGAEGGYVLIPRETRSISGGLLTGVSVSKSEGSAGADAFYCENLACQKIPVEK